MIFFVVTCPKWDAFPGGLEPYGESNALTKDLQHTRCELEANVLTVSQLRAVLALCDECGCGELTVVDMRERRRP